MVDRDLNQAITEANDLLHITQLGDAILQLARAGPVNRTLTLQVDPSILRVINTPGAWLLDTMYTLQLILWGDIAVNHRLCFRAVSNYTHKEMLTQCKLDEYMMGPYGGDAQYGSSDNNRGNQVEHVAWLALEADRCDVIVAMAHHARIIERGPDYQEPRILAHAPSRSPGAMYHHG